MPIWKLKTAMYGTQVASSRWQRLVRETLCDGHWKMLTSVPCVGYNEKHDQWCCFTETISLLRVTTARSANWMACWVHSRSSACRASVQQLVAKMSCCTEGYSGANLDSRFGRIPNTWTRWAKLCCWKMRDLLQHHSHVILERERPTRCAS